MDRPISTSTRPTSTSVSFRMDQDQQSRTSISEVARLRAQIEAERQSAYLARSGFAFGASKHKFITARMERIGGYQNELSALVGEQEAQAIVYAVFESDVPSHRTRG